MIRDIKLDINIGRIILKIIGYMLLYGIVLYYIISTGYYRFTHPEQTETQLMQNLWDALTWKK